MLWLSKVSCLSFCLKLGGAVTRREGIRLKEKRWSLREQYEVATQEEVLELELHPQRSLRTSHRPLLL